jgi:hypothetical protein
MPGHAFSVRVDRIRWSAPEIDGDLMVGDALLPLSQGTAGCILHDGLFTDRFGRVIVVEVAAGEPRIG